MKKKRKLKEGNEVGVWQCSVWRKKSKWNGEREKNGGWPPPCVGGGKEMEKKMGKKREKQKTRGEMGTGGLGSRGRYER